jgi:hypothetical protein
VWPVISGALWLESGSRWRGSPKGAVRADSRRRTTGAVPYRRIRRSRLCRRESVASQVQEARTVGHADTPPPPHVPLPRCTTGHPTARRGPSCAPPRCPSPRPAACGLATPSATGRCSKPEPFIRREGVRCRPRPRCLDRSRYSQMRRSERTYSLCRPAASRRYQSLLLRCILDRRRTP